MTHRKIVLSAGASALALLMALPAWAAADNEVEELVVTARISRGSRGWRVRGV